jgi:hypothetical protein
VGVGEFNKIYERKKPTRIIGIWQDKRKYNFANQGTQLLPQRIKQTIAI